MRDYAKPNASLPSTRAEAIEAGAVRYFNGQPCAAGHVEPRYTLSGYCVVCQRIKTREQKQAAKARRRAA